MTGRGAALVLVILGGGVSAQAATVPAPRTFQEAPPVDETLFPPGPEKAFILENCDGCHTLNVILRAGGDVEGWSSRLVRMIRAGAPLSRDRIPSLAAYLAKAFPERPRPESTGRP